MKTSADQIQANFVQPSKHRLASCFVGRFVQLFALTCPILTGCQQWIDDTYGRRTGTSASSVNGTTVLGEMFAKAGHRVSSWSSLSPALDDADVIVWAPNDFELPSDSVQMWLQNWLLDGERQRTLIYIGRDFDAAPGYWTFVEAGAPTTQKPEIRKRRNRARKNFQDWRKTLPDSAEWPDWFSLDATSDREKVQTLDGPWAAGIDTSQVEIQHHSRLVPDESAEVLLSTGNGQPLVSEIVWEGEWHHRSRVILVENGSFLLNVPLVNREHRKLAGKLIDHIGSPPKRVVFLQSQAGGPPIRDSDPAGGPSGALALFGVWPISGVLVHLAALGIAFALARWPIFGVPRSLQRESLTDFGIHVAALGELLRETGDAAYARGLLRNYRQAVQGEPGVESTEKPTARHN